MLRELLNKVPESIKAATTQSDLRFVCQSDAGDWAELMVVDTVGDDLYGDGLTATNAIAFLKENNGRNVLVKINSGGGLVYEGLQIYNALSTHENEVVARIEGNAFSAASMIAMAADRIEIFENSTIGIHRAAGFTFGNRDDHAYAMEWLDSIDAALVGIYTDRSGQDRAMIEELIRGEVDGTLMSADQAKALGFVDEILSNKKRREQSNAAQAEKMTSVAMAQNRLIMAEARRKQLTMQRPAS